MTHTIEIQKMSGVTIRRLGATDTPAVTRLAQLDSANVPDGDLLGAEIEGTLVAVAPIQGGKTLADPFSRTSELRALLELRAAQLRGRKSQRPRLAGLFAGRLLSSQPLRPTS
jgi:hypothetical protein